MPLHDAREAALQAGGEAEDALAKERAEEYALAVEVGSIIPPQHNHLGNCLYGYVGPFKPIAYYRCLEHNESRGDCRDCPLCPACEVLE